MFLENDFGSAGHYSDGRRFSNLALERRNFWNRQRRRIPSIAYQYLMQRLVKAAG